MNDMRRKLLAYYNSLNQDDMKPCIIVKGNWGYNNISYDGIYCDDPKPESTMKDIVKFNATHIFIEVQVEQNNHTWVKLSTTQGLNAYWSVPEGVSWGNLETYNTDTEANVTISPDTTWRPFTGSEFDWNT